jgi:hypothetical protein
LGGEFGFSTPQTPQILGGFEKYQNKNKQKKEKKKREKTKQK